VPVVIIGACHLQAGFAPPGDRHRLRVIDSQYVTLSGTCQLIHIHRSRATAATPMTPPKRPAP